MNGYYPYNQNNTARQGNCIRPGHESPQRSLLPTSRNHDRLVGSEPLSSWRIGVEASPAIAREPVMEVLLCPIMYLSVSIYPRIPFPYVPLTGIKLSSSRVSSVWTGMDSRALWISSLFRKEEILIGKESSGCYHINLYSLLTEWGVNCCVINPLLISNFMKMSLKEDKDGQKGCSYNCPLSFYVPWVHIRQPYHLL